MRSLLADASPFVVEWIARLAPRASAHARRALDVAMGRGRHAVALARAGSATFGVDVRVRRGARRDAARERGTALRVHGWCADLTQHPLPSARFDVVVVTRYLQRDLFPALREARRAGRRRPLRNVHDGAARARHGADVAGSSARTGRAARRVRRVRGAVLRGSHGAGGGRAGSRRGAKRPSATGRPMERRLQPSCDRAFSRSYSSRGSDTLPGLAPPCDSSP